MKEQKASFAQIFRLIADWLQQPAAPIIQEAMRFETADRPVRNYEKLLFSLNLWMISLTFFIFKLFLVVKPGQRLPWLYPLYGAAWVVLLVTFAIFVANVLVPPRVSVHRFSFIFLNFMQFFLLFSLNPY